MENEEVSKLLFSIGNKIRQLRKAEGISQLDLGNIVGKSSTHIGRIERAEGNPTIKTLYSIASHYKIDIKLFFE